MAMFKILNNKWGRYVVVPLMFLMPIYMLYMLSSLPGLPEAFMFLVPYGTNKTFLICSYIIVLIIWFTGLFILTLLQKRGFFEDKNDECKIS